MLYLFLVAGLFLLPILLRLAIRLRLGIPILYALGMLTVFHSCTRPIPRWQTAYSLSW